MKYNVSNRLINPRRLRGERSEGREEGRANNNELARYQGKERRPYFDIVVT